MDTEQLNTTAIVTIWDSQKLTKFISVSIFHFIPLETYLKQWRLSFTSLADVFVCFFTGFPIHSSLKNAWVMFDLCDLLLARIWQLISACVCCVLKRFGLHQLCRFQLLSLLLLQLLFGHLYSLQRITSVRILFQFRCASVGCFESQSFFSLSFIFLHIVRFPGNTIAHAKLNKATTPICVCQSFAFCF